MPTEKNNQEERLARLEALMEEYRVTAEATRADVKRVREQAQRAARTAKAALRSAAAERPKRRGK